MLNIAIHAAEIINWRSRLQRRVMIEDRLRLGGSAADAAKYSALLKHIQREFAREFITPRGRRQLLPDGAICCR
jgi:hypothetical protein